MNNHIFAFIEGENGGAMLELPATKEECEKTQKFTGPVKSMRYSCTSEFYDPDYGTEESGEILSEFLNAQEFNDVNDFAAVFTNSNFLREEHRALTALIKEGVLKRIHKIRLDQEGTPVLAIPLCGIDFGMDIDPGRFKVADLNVW